MNAARMRRNLPRFICVVLSSFGFAGAVSAAGWVPHELLPPAAESGPTLCQSHYLTPEQGEAVLQAALKKFPDQHSWSTYATHVRQRVQEGAGLAPWPRRTDLRPIAHSRRNYDGYSVENVAFESIPGYFVAGNLYRPLGGTGPRPAVLNTHGHSAPVRSPEDEDRHGRFHASRQARAAMLARLGAVVLAIDMFGYGDSIAQVGQEAHRSEVAMTIQVWNTIRALDYLESLEDVDPRRIAVAGESGGGTQAFLLAALDDRPAASVPVVMVSGYFFGGCPCESGRPVHRSADHFASNAMLAALTAPRPQLVISDGKDWTQHVPQMEFPFLRQIYGYFGAADRVQNVHLPDEGHDYGPSKRAATYAFLERVIGIAPAPLDAEGKVDERGVAIETAKQLRTFTGVDPLPAHALRDAQAVAERLRELQATP